MFPRIKKLLTPESIIGFSIKILDEKISDFFQIINIHCNMFDFHTFSSAIIVNDIEGFTLAVKAGADSHRLVKAEVKKLLTFTIECIWL